MAEQAWYLLSYDISDARRLLRMHRYLAKQAGMLLESLYLYHGSPAALAALHSELRRIAGPSARDVAAYRLASGRPIHAWGTACPPHGLVDFSLPPMVLHRAHASASPTARPQSGRPV